MKVQDSPISKPNAKQVEEELSKENKYVRIWSLYRYGNTTDKMLIIFGIISGLAAGVCIPLMCVLVGSTIGKFSINNPTSELLDQVKEKALLMIYDSIMLFVLAGIAEACWVAIGDRLGIKVRILCLQSIMKKPIEWFDLNKAQELPQKVFSHAAEYQGGIGEKVGKVLMSASMFISGIAVSFIYGWKLALALLSIYPLAVFSSKFMSSARTSKSEKVKDANSKCSGYVDEALSAIRVVYAFCAEKFELEKYGKELVKVQKATAQSSRTYGSAVGLLNSTVLLTEGLGFFIGSFFVQYDIYNSQTGNYYDCASVITVFFSGMFAMISLGLLAPALQSIGEAQIAAYHLYKIIDSPETKVKPKGTRRIPLDKFKGRIEFKDVAFAYPANPNIYVLEKFNAVFEPDKTTGICGETGCGKSTIIQLIERFYEPNRGTIEVDGIDLKELDIDWWRSIIGFVDQDPVLFNTTIKENIEFGKEGATDKEIKQAAIDANAMEFIEKFEKKFETETGLNGNKLSGGQKQRIAIARALVKKPLVFLLDEATSALDTLSEQKVQNVFSNLKKTSIIVAHRLNTIRGADKILVISHGKVAESGTDKELRELGGIYANLSKLQQKKPELLKALLDSSLESLYSLSSDSENENNLQKKKHEDLKKQKDYKNKIWEENWKHKELLISAILLAILSGYEKPVSGALLGMVTFDMLNMDKERLRSNVNSDFAKYLASSVGVFFCNLGVHWLFGKVTSKVICQIRNQLYKHVLSMDVGWFDRPQNQPYSINHILSNDTENVNNMVEKVTCNIIQAISTLAISIAISFSFSINMAAIILGSVPFLILSDAISAKFQIGFAKQSESMYKNSYEILTESLKNFRTITSFSNENRILNMYSTTLNKALSKLQIRAVISGLLYGICQMIPFLIYAEIFYLSAWFLVEHGESPRNTFIAAYSLCFAALEIGSLQQYGPRIGKGTSALNTVYKLLEEQPKIENLKKEALDNDKLNIYETTKELKLTPIKNNLKVKYTSKVSPNKVITNKITTERILKDNLLTNKAATGEIEGNKELKDSKELEDKKELNGNEEKQEENKELQEENKEEPIDSDKPINSNNAEMIENKEKRMSTSKVSPLKKPDPTRIPLEGRIQFENVRFRYPTRKEYTLKGLSFTIEPGENVAIVGPSGSGKSTIIQLLERFYDANDGQVLIDGKDVKDYPLEQLRSSIGYVPQEPYLFDTTIEDNVRYSKQDATDEEVKEACRIADAIDFIEKDARGSINEQVIEFNTESVKVQAKAAPLYDEEGGFKRKVGVRGSLLSGGQKQRLSIARAILRKPDIMLFDEATSALDAETEIQVKKALSNVNKEKTTITIAHRLSAIENTDKVFVLEKGRIVESGTRVELMAKKGYFYRMYGQAWTI